MLIHIKRDSEVFGPYSVEEARGYLSSGRLSLSDFAQLDGTSEWIPLASVPGIASAPPPPVVAVTSTSPAPAHEDSAQDISINFGWLIRDVALVWGLTFIGGFVIGLAGGVHSPTFVLAIAVSNMLLGTVGFLIVGCIATRNRWRHLLQVAVGVWLGGLVNIILGASSFMQWFFSALIIGVMLGVGGALSFAFKKEVKG